MSNWLPVSNRLPVSALPIVVTVKFNGRTLAERSPLQLLPTMTWEAAARLRLDEQASEFMSLPLQVHLYPNGQQRESDRVGASISDAVGGSFALGYAFAVLSFSAPVYGCARPAAKGVNAFPAAARAEGGTGELCLPELYTCGEERGSLSYELSLFNAVILQFDRQGLGIRRDEREGCGKVATRVRNALWLMAGVGKASSSGVGCRCASKSTASRWTRGALASSWARSRRGRHSRRRRWVRLPSSCARPSTLHAIPLKYAPLTLDARLDPAVLAGRAYMTPGLSRACFTSPATT